MANLATVEACLAHDGRERDLFQLPRVHGHVQAHACFLRASRALHQFRALSLRRDSSLSVANAARAAAAAGWRGGAAPGRPAGCRGVPNWSCCSSSICAARCRLPALTSRATLLASSLKPIEVSCLSEPACAWRSADSAEPMLPRRATAGRERSRRRATGATERAEGITADDTNTRNA